MNAAPPALSPAAAGLCRLLEAASSDGHTVLPVAVAGSVLGGVQLRLENALREIGPAGSGLVSAPAPGLLGFRRTTEAEQAVAAAVDRLSSTGALFVVAGPPGKPRDAAVREIGSAAVADDAEYLDVETLAAFFAACDDDEPVILAGDLVGLGSPGAGRGFADIAESGLAAVTQVLADPEATGVALRQLANAIAAGELGAVSDPTHEAVLVAAASTAEAAYRVTQLVGDSIPRVIGIDPADIQVLTPLVTGGCGTTELAMTLAASSCGNPLLVHDSLGRRWPAVVLVLPPESSGVLSRSLVYSAVTRATRHISIVNATGAALGDAVRHRPSMRRRTLLGSRLGSGYLSSDSHSRSSTSSVSSVSSSSSSPSSSMPSTGPNGVTSSYAENSASS
ncbi:MAG: hypothetical protein ACRDV3_16095 [Acidothermaceae bacterium]